MLSRRQLLKAALSLPLVHALGEVARAQVARPLNFVCIYHPHGVCAEFWAQRASDSASDFDIRYENCSLQPFDDPATYGKSFKDKLLIIEGLDHLSDAYAHESAATILTGSRITNAKPQNASLDQVLAVEHMLGAQTPVTSVSLGVGDDAKNSGVTLSYGVGGAPLPTIIDPAQAFDMLFASLTPAGAAKRRTGLSILDFIRGEITAMQSQLGAREREKLDQHVSSLRDMEKRLTGRALAPLCNLPQRAMAFPELRQREGGEPYFDAITDAHIDVLAHALACGVTRFATLYMNDLSYAGNPLGLPEDNHGRVAHTYSASPLGNDGRPGDGDPESWLPLAKLNRYSYSKVARFMQRLDALGALDNTLIYVTSDMGNPSRHSTQNVPALLCGGTGGKFRMGRRIRLGADCSDQSFMCGPGQPTYAGVSNNHLLISIAQAFGVELDEFGTQAEDKHKRGALSALA